MIQLRYLLFLLVGLSFACTGADESPKSLVNVFIVDAPAQWDSVVVEIQGVELDFVPNGREGQIEKIFFPYELVDKEIDLSQLVGGTSLPVNQQELGLGLITGATLRLGTKNNLYQGDRGYALALPEGETDYSANLRIDLQAGISYDIIVDFDLEKSIQQTSTSPIAFDFNPTIRINTNIGLKEVTGTISPTTLSPVVYAIKGSDSISTHTNASGKFLFRLEPGTYTFYIDPKISTYKADTLLNEVVAADDDTALGTITLSKK